MTDALLPLRFVEAEYIDSGTFVADEDDLFVLHYTDPEKGKRVDMVLCRRSDVAALNRRTPSPKLELPQEVRPTAREQAAVENLTKHQGQCDEDGVTVEVSREALDVAIAFIRRIAGEGA